MERFRTIHYGIGPIGAAIVRLAAEKPWLQIVGGIDIDEAKAGRDLGKVAGLPSPLGVSISNDAEALFSQTRAEVVVHTTSSYLAQVLPQLRAAIRAGANVVSTCEELVFPQAQNPEMAEEIDHLAKEAGVTVLGTGVNPGFVMDFLVIALSGACQEVRQVRATRVVDASTRRLPLQRKIGAGLSVEEFKRGVAGGVLRHVGLRESIAMIAHALGWRLDEIQETVEPAISAKEVRTQFLEVKAGQVAGVRQVAQGMKGGREAITLELQMYVGAEEPRDSISIEGTPSMNIVVKGGTPGDVVTPAVVINAIPRLVAANPGLVTMYDLPPLSAWSPADS